jgi:inosine/xanthosine triphosphatase
MEGRSSDRRPVSFRSIAVGSSNPAKVAAAEAASAKLWPGAKVVAVEAASGVAEQPRTDEEAVRGAENRARAALAAAGADLGLGLEGNTVETPDGMFLSGWAVAVDRSGRRGIGCGGRLLLPPSVADEVRRGRELGPVMDERTGGRDTKKGPGAVGILTKGLVSRPAAFETAVIYALVPFLDPDLYS